METLDTLEPPPAPIATSDGEDSPVYILLQSTFDGEALAAGTATFKTPGMPGLTALHDSIASDLAVNQIDILESNQLGLPEDCLIWFMVPAPPYEALKSIRATFEALKLSKRFSIHYLIAGEACFRRYRIGEADSPDHKMTLAMMLLIADRINCTLQLAAARAELAAEILETIARHVKKPGVAPKTETTTGESAGTQLQNEGDQLPPIPPPAPPSPPPTPPDPAAGTDTDENAS